MFVLDGVIDRSLSCWRQARLRAHLQKGQVHPQEWTWQGQEMLRAVAFRAALEGRSHHTGSQSCQSAESQRRRTVPRAAAVAAEGLEGLLGGSLGGSLGM